jgi:hypothetical protein
MKKLEFVGSKEMRQTAMVCVFAMLKYNSPIKRIKALMNSTTKQGDIHALMDIDSGIWHDFIIANDSIGRQVRRPESQRVRLTGEIKDGYRIVIPYNPAEPKAISLELWREKEVLTIFVDEELKVFGRVMYKLGGNPKAWQEPVEINGEVLRLGHWMAAFICKAMGDEAGFSMYHDEGLELV